MGGGGGGNCSVEVIEYRKPQKGMVWDGDLFGFGGTKTRFGVHYKV